MDDDDLELKLLMSGPENEANLYEILGGTVGSTTLLRNLDGEWALQEIGLDNEVELDGESALQEIGPDNEVEDYLEPSMLGCFLPSSSLGHGRRSSYEKPRLFTNNFGSHEHSTSGGRKHGGRKNNGHWTENEVRQLVKGVAFYGVGKWSSVKRKYFQASIRTSAHLKDKWKNLVKASKKENGRMLLHLEQSLIEDIKKIDANMPYPKQNTNNEDLLAPISPNPCSVSSPSPLAQWSTMKTRTKKGSKHKLKNNKEDTTIISPI